MRETSILAFAQSQKFTRRIRAHQWLLFAVILPGLLVQSTAANANPQNTQTSTAPQLYFFTYDGCRPCKEIEPMLLDLTRQGYPVTRIDTNVHRNWVQQFNVASTPTVVLVQGNRELVRHSGFIDARTITSWFAQAGFDPDATLPTTPQAASTQAASTQAASTQASSTHASSLQPARAPVPRASQTNAGIQRQASGTFAASRNSEKSTSVSPYTLVGGVAGEKSEQEFIAEYTRQRAADNLAERDSSIHRGTREPANQNEADVLRATVRLRVEDPEGISFATGTVIHCHEGEWLVVTCGHVFRDSDGEGEIKIEFDFDQGAPRSAAGSLIYYEAGNRDIGLVAVSTGLNIKPVEIANRNRQVSRGDSVFSLGCDHGEVPTIRRTKIKNRALYNGITKYDIYGRPVDGRSGGGLFTENGRLIGICNAAAVEFDEGIYTALETVYWQLETVGLDHLFESSSSAGIAMASTTPPVGGEPGGAIAFSEMQPLNRAPQNRGGVFPDDRVAVAPRESVQPNSGPSVQANPAQSAQSDPREAAFGAIAAGSTRNASWNATGNQPISGTRAYENTGNSGRRSDDLEVIVIVRSRVEPAMSQAITLPDPSDELLEYLERVGNRQIEDRSVDVARLRLPVQRTRYR